MEVYLAVGLVLIITCLYIWEKNWKYIYSTVSQMKSLDEFIMNIFTCTHLRAELFNGCAFISKQMCFTRQTENVGSLYKPEKYQFSI